MKKTKSFQMALFCPLMLAGIMFSTISATVFTNSNALKVEALGVSESSVAKIGTEGYDSLGEAINAVQDGETIVILKDFDSDTPFSINNGKTFTIDFDDGAVRHSFTWNGTTESKIKENIFVIDNNSDVTVKNFKFLACNSDVQGNTVFEVNSNGKLTLINMESKDDNGKRNMPVLNNGGTVIIDGGDIITETTNLTTLIYPNDLNPIVQNLNNATTTFKGNGTFKTNSGSCGVWLGRIITQYNQSTDVDRENPCGTVTIEKGTFSGGSIVIVNGKGNITINDATYTSGNGPIIKTFHGGVKSTITINNITSLAAVFAQVFEDLQTKIDFKNGNVKYLPTRFCANNSGVKMNSISIRSGKFGPINGSTDIHDEIEGHLASGAVISPLAGAPDGYTYKVETPIKIADILPEDFPTTETYAWRSGNNKLYLRDSSLYVTGSESGSVGNLSSIVIKNGNTYVYDPELGATLTFNMSETDNSILESITISEDEAFNGTYVAPHIHNFSYAANDNVITATCEEGCTEGWDENPLTLTLVSPANLSYDGNEKNVTFATGEANAWETAGLELPDITYLIKESGATEYSPFSGIPTNAGDYMAKIIVNGNEAQLQFTISKVELYIKNLPAPSDIDLGQKLSDSTLVGGYVQVSETDTTEVPGSFEWTNPDIIPALADSEVALYNVTFTPVNEENFNKVSCQVMIRINHTHSPTKVNGQAPTCTEDGYKDAYHCNECGMYFENEDGTGLIGVSTEYEAWKKLGDGKISASGHVFAEEFIFDETHHWHECTRVDCDAISEKVEHVFNKEVAEDKYLASGATCVEPAKYYKSCECGAKGTEIFISGNPLGHDFGGEVTYTWNGDKCTASWKCQHAGCNETQSETVTGVYVKDFDATCNANEKGHYEATFTVQGFKKQETSMFDIPNTAKGHDYEITYTWNEDHTKCTANAECSHRDSTITNEATVTIEDGYAIATFENDIFETQRFKLPEPTPKDGLSAGAIVGICVGSIFLLLFIIYLVGYFFSYRKGKLDDKKIKVIYKILPRGEQKLEKND